MNVHLTHSLSLEDLKTLKIGDKISTSYGTGFLLKIGSWCGSSCQCDGTKPCEEDCNVPCLQVELDGGGVAWIDHDKCVKTT